MPGPAREAPVYSSLFQPKVATKCAVRDFPVTNCSAAAFLDGSLSIDSTSSPAFFIVSRS